MFKILHSSARTMTVTYVLALGLLAMLTISSLVIEDLNMTAQREETASIRVIEVQREMCHNLEATALLLVAETRADRRAYLRQSLLASARGLNQSLNRLMHANPQTMSPFDIRVRALYLQRPYVAAQLVVFAGQAGALAAVPDANLARAEPHVNYLVDHVSQLSDGLARARTTMEYAMDSSNANTDRVDATVLGLTLAAIASLGLFLFRPMVQRIEAATRAQEQRTAELMRSNEELAQFAYVASHDLQEPLRMVASYMQLLSRRYRGKLDADADDFIGFAVDGAMRMQQLINDLLQYSRVGTHGKPFVPTDSEVALKRALTNLMLAIEESGAIVTQGKLPIVRGDETQLVNLFQNLISNAVKFRAERPPRIHVAAERNGDDWVFSVQDNGIGFEPQYAERIFLIFQRLHGRGEYPGTGIGLAVCKKIVQRHGGRIWVESQPGLGTTFYFALPAKEGDR